MVKTIAHLTSILENDLVLYINEPENDEPYYGLKMLEVDGKTPIYITGRLIDDRDEGYAIVPMHAFSEASAAVTDVLHDLVDKGYGTDYEVTSHNGGISYSVL